LDTKLKRFKIVGYGFYCIAWMLAIVVATIVFGAISVFIAQEHMIQLNDMPLDPEEGTHYFAGRITNIGYFNQITEWASWICVGGTILFIVLMIAILFAAGRFSRNEEGRYKLNWFDKIWSELHITGCIAAGALCFLPVEYLTNIWLKGVKFSVWEWANPYDEILYGTNMEIFVMVACLVASITLCLACFVSLFKKLKAGEFWEKSLLGGSFFLILRAVKKSDRTMFKVMAVLIVGAVLCATWIGTVLVIVLIIFLVPKGEEEYVYKFKEIMEDVTDVIKCVPMIAEIECSTTNWRDKVEYGG
jgi:hypothetical protein